MGGTDDKCAQQLTISCIDYFDGKFEELEKRNGLKDSLTKTALDKAEASMNYRLDALNHIKEQTSLLLPRAEFVQEIKNLEYKIAWLTKTICIGIGILLVIEIVWKYLKP
jgi:hypothetical protein